MYSPPPPLEQGNLSEFNRYVSSGGVCFVYLFNVPLKVPLFISYLTKVVT